MSQLCRHHCEVNSPGAGVIKELLVKEEDNVVVGQDLVRIELGKPSTDDRGQHVEDRKSVQEVKSDEDQTQSEADDPSISEANSGRQRESGHKQQPPKAQHQQTSQTSQTSGDTNLEQAGPVSSTAVSSNRQERRVKMNRMRLRIAERLKQSQNTAASLTTFNEVDMSKLIEFRRSYLDQTLKKTGVKLGFMSAFSRAVVLAMRDIPAVNASIEGPDGGDTIVYRDYVDISVAVATEKGLVTPVVRNVETLDMIGVERAIGNMGKKARDGKLSIEDMAGGTFTISNGGIFGSLMGTPIINLPQSAVLGLHAIKDRPVAVNGEVRIRPMMYLALTYDHRLLDGREAVQFLVKIKEYAEDPMRMLL
ncbi:hypothetical protein CDD80_683 [Ophiocordyceps camponoti-rufipedis]|uniref:dihydrolipoyllysine-residue succinyltransferase n=1 Tax=Ophiocordyceps camponoti-rufipedis TaxID=2004952 RepID=A0A2C5XCT1_9HYPO|nr:hypothetical protein CDD80_683 [Ophiocordyceps camponoti-rufipedis]